MVDDDLECGAVEIEEDEWLLFLLFGDSSFVALILCFRFLFFCYCLVYLRKIMNISQTTIYGVSYTPLTERMYLFFLGEVTKTGYYLILLHTTLNVYTFGPIWGVTHTIL